jgi:hypothetical protein
VLGLLHAGRPDEELAAQLTGRATANEIPPEMALVKILSVVSIGRMKAVSQAGPLRAYVGPKIGPTRLGMAFRWTLIELTHEDIPEPDPIRRGKSGWFLEPIGE